MLNDELEKKNLKNNIKKKTKQTQPSLLNLGQSSKFITCEILNPGSTKNNFHLI